MPIGQVPFAVREMALKTAVLPIICGCKINKQFISHGNLNATCISLRRQYTDAINVFWSLL